MSKKPHRKKKDETKDRSVRDALSMQKRMIKKAFLDYLGAAIIFFVMAIAVFAIGLSTEDVSHSRQIIFGAVPIVLGFALLFTFCFLRRFVIFKGINKITPSSVQPVDIICKKAAFLAQPVSKHYAVIICIVFTDENGRRYYCVTEGFSAASKKAARDELLNAEITLNCYANTDYVKSYRVHTDATEES